MFINVYYVSRFSPRASSCFFWFLLPLQRPGSPVPRCVAEPTIWAREIPPGSIKESVALRGLGAFCGFRILSIFIGGVMPHFLKWGYPQISSHRRFLQYLLNAIFMCCFVMGTVPFQENSPLRWGDNLFSVKHLNF